MWNDPEIFKLTFLNQYNEGKNYKKVSGKKVELRGETGDWKVRHMLSSDCPTKNTVLLL
jgi:hypothetical protein